MRLEDHVFALALVASVITPVPATADEAKLERKLEVAREVYLELFDAPDHAVPAYLLEDAQCIAVLPNVIKGAFGFGGRHGRGVVSCRGGSGEWSPPSFVEISGGSIGLQIGGESSDLVLFFMTERGVRSLLSNKFTLGGEASVAAGPVGRTAEVGTDLKLRAEIYSYARSRGLFAGLSLEGARLAPDNKANRRFYGEFLDADEILFDHQVPRLPTKAAAFVAALP